MDGLGQAAGHESDHGPQDHGFVAGREAFVVAVVRRCLLIQANVLSTTHRRGSTSNACAWRLATIWIVIFKVAAQAVSLLV